MPLEPVIVSNVFDSRSNCLGMSVNAGAGKSNQGLGVKVFCPFHQIKANQIRVVCLWLVPLLTAFIC